ncbi:hypothetical protein CSC70_02195 [Pseudoxanthomonas kalamensis DSM 18571]|uniref:hypothetical protein n=1 Tax=Pseudoxanthomonas kalamensis TaxID=289483 RepID=UPI001391B12D|nr:hypothetical protein [Pseudoxanthomonas kalamensis]KAF1712355.1 hypothetical protein CSC70_02195 [Pseudoxanthomonas kalamensis DSM 18571]
MKHNRISYALIVALAGSIALVGCKKKEEPVAMAPAPTEPAPAAPMMTPAPISVTGVTIGNSVDASGNVAASAMTAAPGDTLYASVATDGTANGATLASKWTYQDGQTVSEETKTLNTTGPGVSTFSISKPDGFPTGTYTFEAMLDGASAGTATIEVK